MTLFKLFILTIVASCQLSALSMGRKGEPYTLNNVSWQPVQYVDNEAGFEAILPGKPSSCMTGTEVYIHSTFNQGYYEVQSFYKSPYTPPQSAELFLEVVKNANPNGFEFTLIPSTQNNVLYIVQACFENDKIARFFCSRNKIYQMIFQGNDASLAPTFFESMKVTY